MKNDDPKYISWLNEHGLREGGNSTLVWEDLFRKITLKQ